MASCNKITTLFYGPAKPWPVGIRLSKAMACQHPLRPTPSSITATATFNQSKPRLWQIQWGMSPDGQYRRRRPSAACRRRMSLDGAHSPMEHTGRACRRGMPGTGITHLGWHNTTTDENAAKGVTVKPPHAEVAWRRRRRSAHPPMSTRLALP